VEAWIEVNLVPGRVQDETLLELVDELVHEKLADDVATWFYFWEPELRLRIRWRDPARARDHRATVEAELNSWQARRKIKEWYEGSHGVRGRDVRKAASACPSRSYTDPTAGL
jgi:hypothetical protein